MSTSNYVCFSCRKSYKKDPRHDSAKFRCSNCGKQLVDMGMAFRPPKRGNNDQWRKVEALVEGGATFTYDGGEKTFPLPQRHSEVAEYLSYLKKNEVHKED